MAKMVCIGLLIAGVSYPILYYHLAYNTHLNLSELEKRTKIEGKVARIDNFEHSLRLTIKVDQLEKKQIAFYQKVLLYLYVNKSVLTNKGITLHPGDRIKASVKLKPITATVNEGLYDRRLHNFYRGLKYKGGISAGGKYKDLVVEIDNDGIFFNPTIRSFINAILGKKLKFFFMCFDPNK